MFALHSLAARTILRIGGACGFAALAAGLALVAPAAAQEGGSAPTAPRRLGLLVGCSDYPNLRGILEPLYGPPQDVALMRRVLVDRFGFSDEAIQTLVTPLGGWESTPEPQRPTRANIAAAFARLAREARPGDQVVILIAAHGSYQPVDADAPDLSEADGVDEVLLPADAGPFEAGKTSIPNGIPDNEMARWLASIADAGAFVWIIFDTCHSGDMTRSADTGERSRHADPLKLGLAQSVIDSARSRLANPPRARGTLSGEGSIDIEPGRSRVVALYATRPHELAPEVPKIANPPRREEGYHGLLTYTVCEVLQQQQSPLNYRELAQRVQVRYAGRTTPRPYAEGDVDREVLGLAHWPDRSRLVLSLDMNRNLRLAVGTLAGLRRGTVLRVYGPAGSADADRVLGHVEITQADPVSAEARSIALNDLPEASVEALAGGRCDLLLRDAAELKVKVAIRAVGGNTQAAEALRAMIEALPENARGLIELLPDTAGAHLVLEPAADGVRVIPGEGEQSMPGAGDAAGSLARVLHGEGAALPQRLEALLRNVFKWRNLLALAASGDVGENLGVRVELRRAGKPVFGETLFVGEKVDIYLANTGSHDVDVTVLVLDQDFGVTAGIPGGIGSKTFLRAGETMPITGVDVTADTVGQERLLVIAAKANRNGVPPVTFEWLSQPTLLQDGVRGAGDARDTPLGQILAQAAYGSATRSLRSGTPNAQLVVIPFEVRHRSRR